MKATVNKADLLRAASTAERAVNTKSSLPILSTLLLKIEEGRLHLAATDLEIGLKTVVEVTDYEEGSVAVPASLFADVIKAAPAATLTLEVTDTHLIVKSGKSRYKVPVFGDASEFPVLPEVQNLGQIVVKESVLREALERITVACAAEDTRPILMGAFWTLEEGSQTVNMVATDTHRLHMANLPVSYAEGSIRAIVGGRALRELTRLLTGPGEVSVIFDLAQIQVSSPTWGTLTGRLTEGQFPKVDKVIPDLSQGVSLDRQEALEAVRRASIVAVGGSDRLKLAFTAGEVLMEANSDDEGKAEEQVESQGDAPADACEAMALNWKYLLQAIQANPDSRFTFYRDHATRPVLLHGQDKSQFLAVVMPMQM